jgi:hypothetical protein
VCVLVALSIQHAVRLHHVVNCGLPRSTVFFQLISQKAPFSKKLLNTKFVLIFSKSLSEKFVIPRRIKRAIIVNYNGIHVKYPLSDFNKT